MGDGPKRGQHGSPFCPVNSGWHRTRVRVPVWLSCTALTTSCTIHINIRIGREVHIYIQVAFQTRQTL